MERQASWRKVGYGRTLLVMHGDTRRLYREMREEGYDPNRGLGPLLAIVIVTSIVATVLLFVAVMYGFGFIVTL